MIKIKTYPFQENINRFPYLLTPIILWIREEGGGGRGGEDEEEEEGGGT